MQAYHAVGIVSIHVPKQFSSYHRVPSISQIRPTSLANKLQPSQPFPLSYSTLKMTFHPSAPASRMAQARHPLFLRLMIAFQPFCAQSALTSISMSEPNCRFLDSKCICAAAGKLPLRSTTGEIGESRRVRLGDWGSSVKFVMQSMTSTRFRWLRADSWPGLSNDGEDNNTASGVYCLFNSSEMCMTV